MDTPLDPPEYIGTQLFNREVRVAQDDKTEARSSWPSMVTAVTSAGSLPPRFVTIERDRLIALARRLDSLTAEVEALRVELQSRPITYSTFIHTLSDESIKVLLPISVVIQEHDDECFAEWPDIRAFASGSTTSEALMMLKRRIKQTFSDMHKMDKQSLGQIALDTLETLQLHLRNVKSESDEQGD